MCRRVLLWAGLLVVLTGAGSAALVLLRPPSPINPENFERIQVGMSEQEVTDLLGVPADTEGVLEQGMYSRDWNGPRYSILLDFDRDGRVRAIPTINSNSTSLTYAA